MRRNAIIALAIAAGLGTASFAQTAQTDKWPGSTVDKPTPHVPGMPKVLADNLANFDDLDFHVYTNQDWKNLHKSHAADIVVHYPDGRTTKGIPDHIKELEGMWTFAPDNRITEHPVRFGTADGEWTAVKGYTDGTFTKPMTLPDGTVIQPTGRKYHLPMATLARWNKQGTISEEYLFWDNAALMQQLGLAK